jgi:hypothetical protein
MATSESNQQIGPFDMTIPFGLSSTVFYSIFYSISFGFVLLIVYFAFIRGPSVNPDDMPI